MLTCLFKTINKVHSHPNPLWRAILCSFCYRHHWRLHPRGSKKGSGWAGKQMSVVMQLKGLPICQLSVNPIKILQNVFAILKKTEAAFYSLLHFGWKGWVWVGCKNNWMFNFIFSPPPSPHFYFALPPLTAFYGSVNGPFPSFKISCFLITRLSGKPFLWKWVLFSWK